MNDKLLLKEMKKYRRLQGSGMFVSCVLIAVMPFLDLSYFWWVLLDTAAVLFLIMVLIAVETKVRKILHTEMEPQRYYSVYHALFTAVNGQNKDIEIAYFIGDYDKAIEFAYQMKEKKEKKGKSFINIEVQFFLCLSLFEMGRYEEMRSETQNFRAIQKEKRISEKSLYAMFYLPQIDYLEHFADGDYEACKDIRKTKETLRLSNTAKARVDYYTALAYYMAGEDATAQELFKELIHFCPHLHYAALAGKYIV